LSVKVNAGDDGDHHQQLAHSDLPRCELNVISPQLHNSFRPGFHLPTVTRLAPAEAQLTISNQLCSAPAMLDQQLLILSQANPEGFAWVVG